MNRVIISGECRDGKLYSKRKNGIIDVIPLNVNVDVSDIIENTVVCVIGKYKAYDTNGHKHQVIIPDYMIGEAFYRDINEFYFNGVIVKKSTVRQTPKGRNIVDLIVKLDNGSYIPCIAFDDLSFKIYSKYKLYDTITCLARLQSREYTKNNETKIANEVLITEVDR